MMGYLGQTGVAPSATDPSTVETNAISKVCSGWTTADTAKGVTTSGGPQPCGCNFASGNQVWTQSVLTRYLLWPIPGLGNYCSTPVAPTGTESAAAGIAAVTPALNAIPVVGQIAAGIGAAVSSILGIFGGAHQKAEQAQQNALCAAIPAANSALQQIDAGLADGSITPAQASAAYSQLQSQFTSWMKTGTSYKACDALYGYDIAMQMVIAARNIDLQNGVLTGGAPGPWTSAEGKAAAALGLPSWALWGGAAVLAYLLFA